MIPYINLFNCRPCFLVSVGMHFFINLRSLSLSVYFYLCMYCELGKSICFCSQEYSHGLPFIQNNLISFVIFRNRITNSISVCAILDLYLTTIANISLLWEQMDNEVHITDARNHSTPLYSLCRCVSFSWATRHDCP
jgi:hypothetical protein